MLPWLTILFAVIFLLIAIAVSTLLSTTFGTGLGQTFGPVIAWLGIVYTYHRWNTKNTDTENGEDDANSTDSPGPDVEPQSQSYSLRHNPETADANPNTDTGGADGSHATPDSERSDTDTGRQSSLRRSNTDILNETETRLDDHITFYDNGIIELKNDNDLNMYSQMMLYVIAKRLAYQDQCVDAPTVTGADLRDRFNYTKVDFMLFLHESRDLLTPDYRIGGRDNDIPYSEIDEIEVAVDIQPLSTITDWTMNEQQTVRPLLYSFITDAIDYLTEARTRYSDMPDSNDPYSRQYRLGTIREPVKNACKHVHQYPVEIGYDGHWKRFSDYAEALLDYLDDDVPEKTDHCVPEMKRALEHMREQTREESSL